MKRLAIYGASGHGRVVADTAECCGWKVGFYDDFKGTGSTNLVWPVIGPFQEMLDNAPQYDGVIVAIGDNAVRLEKSRQLLDQGATLVTLIHPSATVSQYAQLQPGSVVVAGAIINANARLGLACIINTGAIVDHDCELRGGVHVSPGANLAGQVTVGTCSWVGIGASVRQQIVIGSDVTVAAGAAVVKDVENGIVVAGVPAKKIR